jgi:indolepyruvate ferredoxin oxidoreductase alpha subunit
MERSFSEAVRQLTLGAGQTLQGEGVLVIFKALLQSGVSYLGGYPGAPVAHLLDVMADANEPVLSPLGIYFDSSESEASAAALLGASINYPIRGAVCWKSTVGTNVASDALSHVASAGVLGGTLIIVGEDYGMGASALAERTHSFAVKSSMCLIDVKPDLQQMMTLAEEGFRLSEASGMPVIYAIRIRQAHMRGSVVCKDNLPPKISMLNRIKEAVYDITRIPLPPATFLQESRKFTQRIPAAKAHIVAARMNDLVPGDDDTLGIITQGGVYATTLRALALLGAADAFGNSRVPILNLNVIHPIVPEEVVGFLKGKRRLLVVEEGMPNLMEQEIKALAHDARLDIEIHGKDLLPQAGEYIAEVVIGGVGKFLARSDSPLTPGADIGERLGRIKGHLETVRAGVSRPITKRPPGFCTGCPERPVFSALKIAERTLGSTHYVGDIGCHAFGALAPFHIGSQIMGYGLGLASSQALSRMFGKRLISLMGDGGFWHNGLTTGVANAVQNNQDSVLVILDNFYTSATGQQANPSTGKNLRGENVPGMTIPQALRGVGVKWIKTVNPYKLEESVAAITEAATTPEGGLKVVIAKGECMLERQRRERPTLRKKIEGGARAVVPRFGVDPDVCVGDHSCMRLNGCPSLTLRESQDPLREDPIAHVDQTCVGCGLCGEVAHAAVLCPSFYEVQVIHHPRWWERLWHRANQSFIGWLSGAPAPAA